MGTWWTTFMMKGLLISALFLVAVRSECPTFEPVKCGPEDMPCPKGMDMNACPMPDFCIPMKGPMGKDGFECPSMCPTNCGMDCPGFCPSTCSNEEMMCPGGSDDNGCIMPDFCVPSKGGLSFDNMTHCPAFCPSKCGMEETWCPGGLDDNGCEQPDTCMPKGMDCPMGPAGR